MILILLNILALSGLFASNDIGQNLFNTVTRSLSKIPEDIPENVHQGLGVMSSDQSDTWGTRGVRSTEHTECEHDRERDPTVQRQEGGYHPAEMGHSHKKVKPIVLPRLKRDGSAGPASPNMGEVNICAI